MYILFNNLQSLNSDKNKTKPYIFSVNDSLVFVFSQSEAISLKQYITTS